MLARIGNNIISLKASYQSLFKLKNSMQYSHIPNSCYCQLFFPYKYLHFSCCLELTKITAMLLKASCYIIFLVFLQVSSMTILIVIF